MHYQFKNILISSSQIDHGATAKITSSSTPHIVTIESVYLSHNLRDKSPNYLSRCHPPTKGRLLILKGTKQQ